MWMRWWRRRCSIPCDRWPDWSYNPESALFFRRISIVPSSKRSMKTQVHIDTTATMVVATCKSRRSHMIDQSAVCQVVSFERNAKWFLPTKKSITSRAQLQTSRQSIPNLKKKSAQSSPASVCSQRPEQRCSPNSFTYMEKIDKKYKNDMEIESKTIGLTRNRTGVARKRTSTSWRRCGIRTGSDNRYTIKP